MEFKMQDFLELLFLEKAVHEELLGMAEKKKGILIANDLDALKEISSQEKTMLKKIRELETKREAYVEEIAKAFIIQKDKITLDEIEKHADEKLKKQLSKARHELIFVVSELAECNRVNSELIKTHLDYTYFSLDMMTQSRVPADTYDGSGYMKEDSKNRIGLIDQKV
jgi:flagellar biosynthesis/type III secretory pathway chaperone